MNHAVAATLPALPPWVGLSVCLITVVVLALGYAASIATHLWLNAATF